MRETIINIEQLNLKLPSGFEKRADAIARGVAKQLARMPVAQSIELSALTVPKVKIFNGETDQVIARRIAHSIHAQLHVSDQRGPFSQQALQNMQSNERGRNRGID